MLATSWHTGKYYLKKLENKNKFRTTPKYKRFIWTNTTVQPNMSICWSEELVCSGDSGHIIMIIHIYNWFCHMRFMFWLLNYLCSRFILHIWGIVVRKQASKRSKQAAKQASKQASKQQASKQSKQAASKQTSKQTSNKVCLVCFAANKPHKASKKHHRRSNASMSKADFASYVLGSSRIVTSSNTSSIKNKDTHDIHVLNWGYCVSSCWTSKALKGRHIFRAHAGIWAWPCWLSLFHSRIHASVTHSLLPVLL